jgi:hypothetical protein
MSSLLISIQSKCAVSISPFAVQVQHIKQMEAIPQDSQSLKWNFTPHADIIQTAYELLRQFPITYSHIKAHQDKSEGAKISAAQQL